MSLLETTIVEVVVADLARPLLGLQGVHARQVVVLR
jgi:hypothetical protein